MAKYIQVEGYEGLYSVSEFGDVFSYKSNLHLKPQEKRGYLAVNLYKEGEIKSPLIHRLVAKAFIGNPEDKPQVNHKNGDKHKNIVANLEWATSSENSLHAFEFGLRDMHKGEGHHDAVLTEEQVHEVCSLMQDGMPLRDIEKVTGMSQSNLSNIHRKRGWKHISKDYNFKHVGRGISEKTVLWVVRQLQLEKSPKEIVEISTNSKVTYPVIKSIKNRHRYTDITHAIRWPRLARRAGKLIVVND